MEFDPQLIPPSTLYQQLIRVIVPRPIAWISTVSLTGVATTASSVVKPPRVLESPVNLECRLLHHLALESGPGGANVVVGRILHFHMDDGVLNDSGFADAGELDLIGRLGGASYCRTTDRFDIARPVL
jgi:flavin reductase (DIM6/NTAB) family NADH-FMN oxidoreductase RutF